MFVWVALEGHHLMWIEADFLDVMGEKDWGCKAGMVESMAWEVVVVVVPHYGKWD